MTQEVAPEVPIERFEIYATGLDHPECLAFDRDGDLWAGGEAGQIYRIHRDRSLTTVGAMGGFCGGIAWTPDDGELFVCNPQHGIVSMRKSGEWSVFASGIRDYKLVCPNYGVFDRAGTYYVTDSGNWMKRNGWLLKFTPNGVGDRIAGPLGYANGLALSDDEQTLFMVESDTDRVYRIDLATGTARVYAENVGRLPDGIALDIDGRVFVACYASDDIHHISSNRKITLFAWDRWGILLSRPTNIAFRDGFLYAANLGRTTIARAYVGIIGKPLANQA